MRVNYCLLCEHAFADYQGSPCFTSVFNGLFPLEYPFTVRAIFAIANVSEWRKGGRYWFRIADANGRVVESSEIGIITHEDPIDDIEGFHETLAIGTGYMGPVRFEKPGVYQVVLVYNGEEAHREPLLVSPPKQSQKDNNDTV